MQLQYNLASRRKNLTNASARGRVRDVQIFRGPRDRTRARDKTADRLIWEEIKRPNGPVISFRITLFIRPTDIGRIERRSHAKGMNSRTFREREKKKDSPRVNLLPFALFSALETSSWSVYQPSRILKIRRERGG